jgi:hypothetical protein
MTSLVDCPPGSYCPIGSSTPSPCPLGTYNDQTNAQSTIGCIPCSPGMYCSSLGLTAPSGSCAAGSFCIAGASQASYTVAGTNYGACPQGSYCPAATGVAIPCPSGTYSTLPSLITAADCTVCTAGSYCLASGLTAPQGTCNAGYYCPQGTQMPNPSLYYCKAGQYCPQGSSLPTNCAAGTYQF